MIKFKVDEKEYEMCSQWDEMTLSQFIDVIKINDKHSAGYIGDNEFILNTIEVLSHQPESSLIDIDMATIEKITPHLEKLQTNQIKPRKLDHINIDGVDYVFKKDMNQITMGEKISIEILTKKAETPYDTYFDVLSILLRPGTQEVDTETKKKVWKQEKFSTENLQSRKELFQKELKAVDALYLINFFLAGKK